MYLITMGVFITSARGYDYFDGVFLSVILISTSTTFKLFQQWIINMERISELKQLSYKHELNALKNQINPHFLFNMLNNINHLIRTKPDQANEVVSKLSGFLRHQIYKSDDENVLLISEIEFLKNFLDLEKIRRDDFSIHIQVTHVTPNDQAINTINLPANLFTTFVENAVKHSASLLNKETSIYIEFKIHSHKLEFICRNSTEHIPIQNNKHRGLGLLTIKKRLDLIYQDQYDLQIKSNEFDYTVQLILPI
ncbi:sensor histidine kinase [Sphingobacterium sp. HJSM2_6]|uniref:sensor histidine kinase n=1 Tax=Sphingobacterium sp. HJSM2_6 TaxID=3366264 RepID=UPI003BD54BB0